MIATSATIPSSTRLRVLALSRHLYHLGPRPLFEWACRSSAAPPIH